MMMIGQENQEMTASGDAPTIPDENENPLKNNLENLLENAKGTLNENLILNTVIQVRTLLSAKEGKTRIRQVIDAGFVPFFIECIKNEKLSSKLHVEVTWALTNIASGTSEETKVIVDAGGISCLMNLLRSPDYGVQEQALWTLGNIAGDGPKFRELILIEGILKNLKGMRLTTKAPVSLVRTAAWVISNLCRCKDGRPPRTLVKNLLPLMKELLDYEDDQVKVDVIWALSYISNEAQFVNLVIEASIIPQLISLLEYKSVQVVLPCARTLGNIITGNDVQTQAVLDAGLLTDFNELLAHGYDVVAKEALWMLSNIAVGSPEQIEMIKEDFYPLIVLQLDMGNKDIRLDAAYVLNNLVTRKRGAIKALLEHDVIPAICQVLKTSNALETLRTLLSTLHVMISFSETLEAPLPFLHFIEQQLKCCGGMEKIIEFMNNIDPLVADEATKIRNYF